MDWIRKELVYMHYLTCTTHSGRFDLIRHPRHSSQMFHRWDIWHRPFTPARHNAIMIDSVFGEANARKIAESFYKQGYSMREIYRDKLIG